MTTKKCAICGEEFEGGIKVKLCKECRFQISKLPKSLSYKTRIKRLKIQYEKIQKELSVQDKLLLFSCSKCLWCRYIDMKEEKIYCSMPNCIAFGDSRDFFKGKVP